MAWHNRNSKVRITKQETQYLEDRTILKNGTVIWHPKTSFISDDLKIGKNGTIGAMQHIDRDVIIGDNTSIQGFCYFPPKTRIGDNVFIAPQVAFSNDSHPPTKELEGVTVEDNVQIFIGAKIMGGVTIGFGSIIGMGSVVVCDVPSGEVWFGNPATKRYTVEEYWRKKDGL